jgi:integrase
MKGKLTVKSIPTFEPRDKPFEVVDAECSGLILRVQPSGVATFYYSYKADGRNRRVKIGSAGKFLNKSGKWSFTPAVHPEVARTMAQKRSGEVASGTDPQAEKKRKKAEGKAAKAKTFNTFLDDHYAPFLTTERKSGKATEKRIRSLFCDWLGDKPMDAITPFLVMNWRKKQLEGGKSPATVNRDLTALKAMLSKAVEMGVIAEHPLMKLKPAKVTDDNRVRYLSPDEEARLFKALEDREENARAARRRFNEWRIERHLDPMPEISEEEFSDHLKPLVLLALNTGMRRGELFSLQWGDVDFLHGRLTVRASATKGNKTRYIPLNQAARAVLQQWQKQTGGTGLVFPGKKGKKMDNITTSWENLMASAEIEDFRFHDCRHHFATMTLKSGADIVTVSKLLGHASLNMTMRYSHVSDDILAAAVDRLAIGGGEK